MKLKFIYLSMVLAAGLAGTASCSSDDDNDNLQPPVTNNDQSSQTNYAQLLPGHWACEDVDDDAEEMYNISFDSKGPKSVVLEWVEGEDYVMASGTYSLSGNVLTVQYTNVSVYVENGGSYFKGFSNKQSRTVKYTISSLTNKVMTMKDGTGELKTFTKYKNVSN